MPGLGQPMLMPPPPSMNTMGGNPLQSSAGFGTMGGMIGGPIGNPIGNSIVNPLGGMSPIGLGINTMNPIQPLQSLGGLNPNPFGTLNTGNQGLGSGLGTGFGGFGGFW